VSVKEKFKGIKKRWYFLMVLILLIALAGVAKYGVEKHFKTQIATERVQQTYQLVGNDLLYLENFQSMKITQEEAKALLPLVERLASSTDQNLQRDLAKEIYGQLTPQQYATLLDQGKGSGENQFNGKNVNGEIRKGGERPKETMEKDFLGDRKSNKNGNTIREEALSNVVEKMLTDRSQVK
jgi:hypothetical protein